MNKNELINYAPGQTIFMKHRTAHGEQVRVARVTAVNYNDLGMVTFAPAYGRVCRPSGQGAFRPEKVGTKPFGLVDVWWES